MNNECSKENNSCSYAAKNNFTVENKKAVPCTKPEIIHKNGDISALRIVPAYTEVIQNCIHMDTYQNGFTNSLVFEMNYTNLEAPIGKMSINEIEYSYSSIGIAADQLEAFFNEQSVNMLAGQTSCRCSDNSLDTPLDPSDIQRPKVVYKKFHGISETKCLCCDGKKEDYVLSRFAIKKIPVFICGLDIKVKGCINSKEFTAKLIGVSGLTDPEYALKKSTSMNEIGFNNEEINFTGSLALPTGKDINLYNDFDFCLIVDSIRPARGVFLNSVTEENQNKKAMFTASAIFTIKQQLNLYGTTKEVAAFLTDKNAEIKCGNSDMTPDCPENLCSVKTCQ